MASKIKEGADNLTIEQLNELAYKVWLMYYRNQSYQLVTAIVKSVVRKTANWRLADIFDTITPDK